MTWKNILIVLLAGAVIYLLFFGKSCRNEPVGKPDIIPTKEIVHPVVIREITSKTLVDSFSKIEASLRKSIQAIRYEYATLALKEISIQDSMGGTVDLLPETEDDNEYEAGSKQVLNSQLEQLKTTSKGKDILFDNTVLGYESALAIKDTVIKIKDSTYAFLRQSFNLSIDQNDKLISYSNDLNKQLKSKKRANVFWKVVAIAAGVFILKEKL